MPSYDEIPLGKFLEVVTPTFRSLDIRISAARIEGAWKVAAGTLVARHSTVAAVEETHSRLEETLGVPHAEGFMFSLSAAPAGELHDLLQGVSDGVFVVGGNSFILEA